MLNYQRVSHTFSGNFCYLFFGKNTIAKVCKMNHDETQQGKASQSQRFAHSAEVPGQVSGSSQKLLARSHLLAMLPWSLRHPADQAIGGKPCLQRCKDHK